MPDVTTTRSFSLAEVNWQRGYNHVCGYLLNCGIIGLVYQDAEDIASVATTLAWQKLQPERLPDLALQDVAGCFAFSIAKNMLRKWEKQWFRRNMLLEEFNGYVVEQTMGHPLPPADDALEGAETAHAVRQAIEETLTEDEKAALYMWMEEEPMSAIAAKLGVSANTAKQRMHRIRLKVKATLVSTVQDPLGFNNTTA